MCIFLIYCHYLVYCNVATHYLPRAVFLTAAPVLNPGQQWDGENQCNKQLTTWWWQQSHQLSYFCWRHENTFDIFMDEIKWWVCSAHIFFRVLSENIIWWLFFFFSISSSVGSGLLIYIFFFFNLFFFIFWNSVLNSSSSTVWQCEKAVYCHRQQLQDVIIVIMLADMLLWCRMLLC